MAARASEAPGAENLVSRGQASHDVVYATLRQMILLGEVEPGAWLRQKELTEWFGMSRTPVREALRTLSKEGLVELLSNYGARIAPLSLEEFEELYALRRGIEGLAARLSARQITPEQLLDLHEKFGQLEELAHSSSLITYLQEEWRFRLQCYAITGRERLIAQVVTLREHAERYLRLAYNVAGRINESLEFHRRLLQALEARDEQTAEQVVQEALNWTLAKATPAVAASIFGEGS